jgi:hypothetical protein
MTAAALVARMPVDAAQTQAVADVSSDTVHHFKLVPLLVTDAMFFNRRPRKFF